MHEAVEVIHDMLRKDEILEERTSLLYQMHEAVEVIHDMLRKDEILEERTSLLYQCMKQLR